MLPLPLPLVFPQAFIEKLRGADPNAMSAVNHGRYMRRFCHYFETNISGKGNASPAAATK